MYPQYPPYPYYSAGMSGGYAPDTAPVYMPQQQAYYAQQYPPQPAVAPPPPASGPSVRRLPIKDPSTGLVIPVVTSRQVEEAVADYHRSSQVCTAAACCLYRWALHKLARHTASDSVPAKMHYTRQDCTLLLMGISWECIQSYQQDYHSKHDIPLVITVVHAAAIRPCRL